MLEWILYSVALAGIAAGSYTDLRTREVPDWINFALVGAGLGLRLIFSAASLDASYIIEGLAGFGVFFAIALLMFYTGQWGGGDSKMLMGIGAVLGLPVSLPLKGMLHAWLQDPPLLVLFIAYSLVAGAVYGLAWSIVLSIINWKRFSSEFKRVSKGFNRVKWALIVVLLGLFFIMQYIELDSILKLLAYIVSIASVLMLYMLVFVRSVEKCCMEKMVRPGELTVGDWITEDIIVGKETVARKKDLGLTPEQISRIRTLKRAGKISRVRIKIGIPFVPSFLAAFILALILGSSVFMPIL